MIRQYSRDYRVVDQKHVTDTFFPSVTLSEILYKGLLPKVRVETTPATTMSLFSKALAALGNNLIIE